MKKGSHRGGWPEHDSVESERQLWKDIQAERREIARFKEEHSLAATALLAPPDLSAGARKKDHALSQQQKRVSGLKEQRAKAVAALEASKDPTEQDLLDGAIASMEELIKVLEPAEAGQSVETVGSSSSNHWQRATKQGGVLAASSSAAGSQHPLLKHRDPLEWAPTAEDVQHVSAWRKILGYVPEVWVSKMRNKSAPPSPARPLTDGGTTELFTGPEMEPMILRDFDEMEFSFDGQQYVCDHTAGCVRLVAKAAQGKKGRVVLDRYNFFNSSCARQAPRMEEFYNSGIELRTFKPGGAGFASMHAKSWLIDNRVFITGSCNLTHNGLENNREQMIRTTVPSVIAKAASEFQALWEVASPVHSTEIEQMKTTRAARGEKNEAERQARLGDHQALEDDAAACRFRRSRSASSAGPGRSRRSQSAQSNEP